MAMMFFSTPCRRSIAWAAGFALTAGLSMPSLAAPGEPAQGAPAAPQVVEESLVYIFSGFLTAGGETYSGTLEAAASGPEFELKLANGTTCDAHELEPDKGLLRLPETTCSDGRKLKALFIYQPGHVIRVYGSLGDLKFSSQAHALPSGSPETKAEPSAAPPADLMERPK